MILPIIPADPPAPTVFATERITVSYGGTDYVIEGAAQVSAGLYAQLKANNTDTVLFYGDQASLESPEIPTSDI